MGAILASAPRIRVAVLTAIDEVTDGLGSCAACGRIHTLSGWCTACLGPVETSRWAFANQEDPDWRLPWPMERSRILLMIGEFSAAR